MTFPFNLYLFALLSGMAGAAGSLPVWRIICRRLGVMDDPGHRKIHSRPIPLAGGLAVMTGFAMPLVIAMTVLVVAGEDFTQGPNPILTDGFGRQATHVLTLLAGAGGMMLLGLLDDRFELKPAMKFGGQVLIAGLIAAGGIRITLFVHSLLFSYLITILWIVTVTNALNFLDNMNGLCAGLGATGLAACAICAAAQGQYMEAAVGFVAAGAMLGFLPFNYPKATAFLGDSGSHLVGFLLAVYAVLPHFYSRDNPKPFAVLSPLGVLAVPLLDMVYVVILRWRAGKPFYVGDTNHISHRLVKRGLTPARAVALIWLLSAAAASVSISLALP